MKITVNYSHQVIADDVIATVIYMLHRDQPIDKDSIAKEIKEHLQDNGKAFYCDGIDFIIGYHRLIGDDIWEKLEPEATKIAEKLYPQLFQE